MSAAAPPIWTGIIAFVFSFIRSSILSASIMKVSGSESINTGIANRLNVESAVAMKVLVWVITSSPGPISIARWAVSRAAVPELVATQ